MKAACIISGIIFTLFTALQFNDLDQYNTKIWFLWVAIYAGVSALSFITVRKILPRWVYGGSALTSLTIAVIRVFKIEWEKTVFFNESNPAGNEAGGLLIAALWLGILHWKTPNMWKSEKITSHFSNK